MAFYQHWLTRFVLRKDFLRRAKMRLQLYSRRLQKDEFDDLGLLLDQPKTIFDCGANIGFVTHEFRKRFPSATVYAFEPNPVVFAPLERTFAADPKVRAISKGISRAPGRTVFNQNANSGTSSLYEATSYNRSHWARKATQIEVELTSIDSFTSAEGITSIDVLKLDLEGAELDALVGAERLISQQKIDVIYTEVAIVPLYKDQALLEDLTLHLRTKGYHLYNIYGFNESAIRQAILGNATFVSTRFREQLKQRWGDAQCGW